MEHFYFNPRNNGVSYHMTRTVAKHVQAKLITKVNGNVSVSICGNYLVCDIEKHGICYRFTQPQIADLCYEGVSSDTLVSTIYRDYRNFINKKFFK